MFEIEGTDIKLTRGDSFYAQVIMERRDDDPYVPVEGDAVRFAIKRDLLTPDGGNFLDCEPLLTKTIPIDTLVLTLDPNDTKALTFGRYAYDIEITYASGGVDTFIEGILTLLPEVS